METPVPVKDTWFLLKNKSMQVHLKYANFNSNC